MSQMAFVGRERELALIWFGWALRQAARPPEAVAAPQPAEVR
jgi:hypothetical protein